MGRVRIPGVFVVLALAVLAMLTGCGGGSATTTGAASTATSTSTSASATSSSSSTDTTSSTSTSATSSGASKSAKPAIGMITLSSPAFGKGSKIPTRYTCDGANESPPLKWSKVPAGTKQMLLFVLDLAAGPQGALRWAVGGIDPTANGFSSNAIPAGAVLGKNSAGKAAWAGICPSKGKPHNVVFLLYALRKKLDLAGGFDTKTVQKQLAGNTDGAGVMFGTYQRS